MGSLRLYILYTILGAVLAVFAVASVVGGVVFLVYESVKAYHTLESGDLGGFLQSCTLGSLGLVSGVFLAGFLASAGKDLFRSTDQLLSLEEDTYYMNESGIHGEDFG